MKKELTFLCLKCGKAATVPISKALVLNAVVRCCFPPKGWAMLYPPQEFPARSGICAECVGKAIEEATR